MHKGSGNRPVQVLPKTESNNRMVIVVPIAIIMIATKVINIKILMLIIVLREKYY